MSNKVKAPVKYNANETAIVNFLKANEGKAFTLAEMSAALGFPVASGTVVSLIKKGNVRNAGMVEVPAVKEVSSFGFVADIPATVAE